MPEVYMVGARAAAGNFVDKIGVLLSPFAELIPQNKKVITFVKTNYSQVGNTRHLRPILVRAVVETVKSLGGNPAVTDTSGYSPKGRITGQEWFSGAEVMGYSELALGCERILANGYEGDDGEFISTGGAELGGVEIARAIREAECIVMLSHITAHPMAGLSGALVNLGVECLNNSGKTRVHQGLKPAWLEGDCDHCGACVEHCPAEALDFDGRLQYQPELCLGCGNCVAVCPRRARKHDPEEIRTFQRRVAEAAAAITKTLQKKIIYVNLLTDIVPQPDRLAWTDVPFVPDLGFVASEDPVALDAVTVELVRRAPGLPNSAAEDVGAEACGNEKFGAITGADPLYLLEQAEKMGVGCRESEVFFSEGVRGS
ncbi:MAG TPA: DUF362 domain-containing protein [Spirochaetia bacterium]|nr:DUF362 domain-containing protein [Spirochaetia bacterium]